MATVIMDRDFAEQLREKRRAAGSDRWDEVWEGTYMMAPLPNNEHQDIVGGLVEVLREILPKQMAIVLPGANVSDRESEWTHNYRCPDVVVYFTNTHAKNCGTHWCGGPDFAVEITSPDDQTRDKTPFYSKIGTRELLIIDRDPWSLDLLRLSAKKLKSAGVSTGKKAAILSSRVLPLSFRLIRGNDRPAIEVERSTDGKIWHV